MEIPRIEPHRSERRGGERHQRIFGRNHPSSVVLLVLPLVLGLGCTKGKGPSDPPPKADRASALHPTPNKAPAMQVPQGKTASFEQELARVEQVRGLSHKSKVSGLLVAPDELARHLERALEFERPAGVLRGTELMLRGLRLVPARFDFHSTLIKLLRENLAGLYEPRLELMMVREDLPAQSKQITLLHELVHALQDQHFDLDEIISAHPDDSDKSSALSCLAEGDATSAMLDGVLPDGKTALDLPPGSIEAQFFAQAPETEAPGLIIRSLYAPYLDGLNFVHHLRRRGGFAEVNRAFLRPPLSTEQVLHLDKYDTNEPPLPVAVPKAPAGQWELVLHDIWGEQSLRIALEEWSSAELSARGAAGWGGDRIVAYEQGERRAVAWDIIMDNAAEAAELWEVLLGVRDKLGPADEGPGAPPSEPYPPATTAPAPSSWCVEGLDDQPSLALALRGDRLLWLGMQGAGLSCTETQRWLETL